MLNAISLDNIRAKKKTDLNFIIPASFIKNTTTIKFNNDKILEETITTINLESDNKSHGENKEIEEENIAVSEPNNLISKYSLLGLQRKKESDILQKEKLNQKVDGPVTEIEISKLLYHWNNFAKKLNENGEKIMYTYMVLDIPKINENVIELEFPNQSSRDDFYKRQGNLVAYLRENLFNVEITINITVSEDIKQKFVYTAEEKYNKLKELNPELDRLRRIFELELN